MIKISHFAAMALVASVALAPAAFAHTQFGNASGAGVAAANFGGFLNANVNHTSGTETSSGSTSLSGSSQAGFQQNFASPKTGDMNISFNTTGAAHNDTTFNGSTVTSNSSFNTAGFSKGNADFSNGVLASFAQGSGSQTSKFSNNLNVDKASVGLNGGFSGIAGVAGQASEFEGAGHGFEGGPDYFVEQ